MAEPHGLVVPGAQGIEPGGGQGDDLGFCGGFIKLGLLQFVDKAVLSRLDSFVFVLGSGGGGNGFGMLPEAAEKPLHTQDQGFVLDFTGGRHAVGAVPVIFAHPPHGFAALGTPGQDADIFGLRALQPAGHIRPGALGLVEQLR